MKDSAEYVKVLIDIVELLQEKNAQALIVTDSREALLLLKELGFGEEWELLLSDVLGTDGEEVSRGLEEDAEAELLHDALARLGKREKDIIELRFGLGGHSEHTQKEVAERMGISQSYISRLEKRIITQLRRELSRAML